MKILFEIEFLTGVYPLREGYGYEITFRMEQGSEETPGLAGYVETATIYNY
jgi:hypothetical protein